MIQEFTNYLVSIRRYSENTARAYEKDLIDFVHYMLASKTDARWSTIKRDDIDGYIMYQTGRGLKPTTINRRISAIRHLYNYMKRQGLLQENPARFISQQKTEKTIPNTIPSEDLLKALEHAAGITRIMLILLVTTGIRIQEMLDIEQSDIEASRSRILIHGKGQKERYVSLSAAHMKEVLAYSRTAPYRIFSPMGQREARSIIYNHLSRYTDARQCSPHAIRHSFATNMAQKGANCTTIAKILGHESIKTTQKYIDLSSTDTAQAFSTYNFI